MNNFIVTGKLTDKEIQHLKRDINFYSNKAAKGGVTGKKLRYDPDVRECLVYFVSAVECPFTVNVLHSTVIENYQSIYRGLDYGELSSFQYVKYNKGGFFKRHQDVVNRHKDEKQRCLTMSINLTDPDEYEGGELVIYHDGQETVLSKDVGSFVIFPAFVEHECKEITRGTRQAIVTWTEDQPYARRQFQHHYNSINSKKQ